MTIERQKILNGKYMNLLFDEKLLLMMPKYYLFSPVGLCCHLVVVEFIIPSSRSLIKILTRKE
jgi:hypothetical protein